MRSLDDLATIQSGITLTRDNRERLVTITGGVLKVNTWLDTSSIAPGWRILCKSSGGLAFDAPDFSSTGIDITPTSVFASYLNVSVDDFDRVQAGDPFTVENDGGYTGPDDDTTYYVGKSEASPGSNAILIAYKTKAAALSNSNNADDYIAWSGSGTASDVVLAFASRTGRLDIGTIGADGEPQIQIIEDETAHKFGGDNYASNSSVSRFQSGKVEFNNVFWAVDTNQSATRSDFDIYMGDSSGANMPEVTLNNCKIVTDTRFNHFGSNQLTINGLDFTNTNTDAPTGAEVEFVLPPASMTDLNLKSPSKGIRVLPFSQPNDTPIVLQNLTGGTKIGTVDHVPTGRNSQIVGEGQNKYVHTIDLAGEITRVSNERVGNVRDLRTVNFQFDDIAPSLIADQEIKIKATSSGFPTVAITNPLTLTIDSSGQTSGVLLYKNFGHASATGAHNNTYQLTVNTPNTRRYQTTFTVNGDDDGAPQLKAFALSADLLPDGTKPHTIQPPTECTTLTQIHRAIKSWEATNYDVEPKGHPLVFVYEDELRIRSAYSVVLSRTATDLIDITGSTITIKCGATLGTSNGLKAIKTTGVGTSISVTGTIDTSAVWLRDSNGQESKIVITNNMGDEVTFSVVKKTDGTKPASSLSIADGSTGTISISTKGLGSGYNVVGKRKGYHAFVYEVDLSAGGEFNITATTGRQIKQPTGAASYPGSEVVTTGISISDESDGATPGMHIGIGNTTYTADQIFKRFEDYLATSYGGRYLGLGGDQMIYTSDTIKGDQLYLGSHIKVKRSDAAHANATIRASLFADDRAPIESTNGDIMTVEGLDLPALAKTIIIGTDFDTEETGTQSIWGKLGEIATAVASNETEIAGLNSEVEGNSTNLSDLADKIDANKTAIDAIKTVVDSNDTKLDTNKTAIDGVKGVVDSNSTDISAAKSVIDSTKTLVDSIHAKATTNSASITSLTALVNNMPRDVWDYIIDDTIREDLDFVPVSIGSEGNTLHIPTLIREQLQNGDEIIITNLGGYGGLSLNTSYYLRKSPDFSALFATKEAALDGSGNSLAFTDEGGSGVASNMRFTAKNVVKIGDGNYLMKQVHDTVSADVGGNANLAALLAQLSTDVSNVSGEVWAETSDGRTTYQSTMISLARDTVAIEDKVDDVQEAIDKVPGEVWIQSMEPTSHYEFLLSGYYGDWGFGMNSNNNTEFVRLFDGGYIQNGDKVRLIKAAGTLAPDYEIEFDTVYYLRINPDLAHLFTLYTSYDNAIKNTDILGWNSTRTTVGFAGNTINVVFEEKGTHSSTGINNMRSAVVETHDVLDDDEFGLGSVTGSLTSLATAVSDVPSEVWGADLDPDLSGTQDIRTAIQKINTLMGDNFVESDVNLQLAMRLILAVLVGKLTVTNEGGTFKFHRLDTGETAAVSANAGELGRSSIRFGNNIDA